VDPDGNVTNADCSGDLLVRLTSRSQSHDLSLTRRKRFKPLAYPDKGLVAFTSGAISMASSTASSKARSR
jgi:hypothetical protein